MNAANVPKFIKLKKIMKKQINISKCKKIFHGHLVRSEQNKHIGGDNHNTNKKKQTAKEN